MASPALLVAWRSQPKSLRPGRRSTAVLVIVALWACYKYLHIMPSVDVDLSQYTESIFIPYVFKFSTKHVPQVMCTIDGVDIEMPVDTGSTGLLVGASILPNVDSRAGEPAHHFFTSSKILYVGRLVELPVMFGGEGSSFATANVPILIVDKSWTCPWYDTHKDTFTCSLGPNGEKPVDRDISNITYMGVGFGRNAPKDGMPYGNPRLNPFLNIDSIDGRPLSPESFQPGYIVSTEGVHLGVTPRNTRGFAFANLQPGLTHRDDPRDWAMARVCFTINDKVTNCGSGLVDTGIAQMYIRAREGTSIPQVTIRNPNKHGRAKMVKRVKPGTKITVDFLLLEEQIPSYSFIVGDGSAIEPSYVVPSQAASPAFVNSGRHFLFGYSVAFDAIGGRFGIRPVHPNSSSVL